VNLLPDHGPDKPGESIRLDARLDAVTRQKVDDLARRFRQPRAAVLSHIMWWGLSRAPAGALDGGASHSPVRHLSLYVPVELHARAQNAAAAAGVHLAPWLRHIVQHIGMADFPARWYEGQAEGRSHESRRYGRRFMLRLDEPTRATLDALAPHFETSGAEIIRQLLAQATPEVFPAYSQLRAVEPRYHQRRPHGR
jgi:predicted HicB family RNase H-like nuclease